MKIKLQIKSRWTGSLLFEYEKEDNTIRETLLEAVKAGADLIGADLIGANLIGADLSGADLSGADLSGANLSSADLSGANLRSANLSSADLRYANLSSADLRYANLSSADLRGANLSGADLIGANLIGADLSGADLIGADLSGADLRVIKYDMWAVLLPAISEIPNLKKAILEGKIDGSTYEGECACLCGTIEKTVIENIKKITHDRRDVNRPIERFFLGIKKGDTPETSQFSKLALEWIEEFESYLNTKL